MIKYVLELLERSRRENRIFSLNDYTLKILNSEMNKKFKIDYEEWLRKAKDEERIINCDALEDYIEKLLKS